MHPPTHFLASWIVGSGLENRRDRVLVTWAGVISDIDGLTILGGKAAFATWHHVIAHGLSAAAIVTALWTLFGKEKWKVGILSFIAFHLHLLLDYLGSGGDWTITYLYPFSTLEIPSFGGWPLNSWQNMLFTSACIIAIGIIGVKKGRTFLEAVLPKKIDDVVVVTLKNRFASTKSKTFVAVDSTNNQS